MKGWILSIVGMVLIGVIFEIIVPDGKTNSFIKSIFAIFFMFVVVSPIINLVKNSDAIDFSTIFSSASQNELTEQSLMELKFQIENHLSNNGVSGVEVEVMGYSTLDDTIIEQIYVNLSNLVILKKDEHIDKYKLITTLIKEKVEIDEGKIVYG